MKINISLVACGNLYEMIFYKKFISRCRFTLVCMEFQYEMNSISKFIAFGERKRKEMLKIVAEQFNIALTN